MKRYVVPALAMTLLAACSSAGSLRNSKPTASYAGAGSAGDIASCVSNAWGTKPVHLESHVLYTGTTIEIHKTPDGPAVALVDIKPVSDRTVATYYSNFDEDDTWYFEQVAHCVDTTPPPPQ
ncbi:lipoprotein [Dyella telluris]|uniref:Membrane lipoprotein lipid attachment site-containing protein n=1 Tax=Dyella telluris TaxID=2763498 RepID=A0A7G8Q982_9GAMM|nr:lipoprotein [Dyella telluris]QNK03340.1 membrane lipoprotein lipid attachment site-containing protein [Dyella telluris]